MLLLTFLTEVADKIGSNWFACGPYLDKFNPLELEVLRDPEQFSLLYLIGWKAGAPEEAEIRSALENHGCGGVRRTTLGYHFVIRADQDRVPANVQD